MMNTVMQRISLIFVIAAFSAAIAVWGAAAADATKNPYDGDAVAIREGEKIFDDKCSDCHLDGTGGSGPNIIDDSWEYGGSDDDVFQSIAKGRKGGMPSWSPELKDEDIWKVIAYIRSLRRK